jgi:hypothetical protein
VTETILDIDQFLQTTKVKANKTKENKNKNLPKPRQLEQMICLDLANEPTIARCPSKHP